MDSKVALRELLVRYGIEQETAQERQFRTYLELLEKWNSRINLTASTQWSAVGVLFEEAIWAARHYPRTPLKHLDIGSGAGFPAIPLKILRPWVEFHLVDSRAKRCTFLETVASRLGLEGIKVSCQRIELYLQQISAPRFDIVSWKGLKLSTEALDLLLSSGHGSVLFWVFHGSELPLADPSQARRLKCLVHEIHPCHPGRQLSIFECFT